VTALTERKMLKHMQKILPLDRAYFPGEPWSKTEFLAPHRKKWVLSRLCETGPPGNREVAGYLIAYLYNRRLAHISRLTVKSRYRGRGVSRRLLHAVKRNAKRIGATEVTVEVNARALSSPKKYQRACRFYSTLGFTPISGQQLTTYLRRKDKLALSGEYLDGQEQHTVFRLAIQHPDRHPGEKGKEGSLLRPPRSIEVEKN